MENKGNTPKQVVEIIRKIEKLIADRKCPSGKRV